MKQLYEVRTKRYATYYVFAFGFDEAAKKVENKIIEQHEGSLFDENGSLKQGIEMDEVKEVKLLNDGKIIM